MNLGRSFPFGRRNSPLIVFHAGLRFCDVSGVNGLRLGGLGGRMLGVFRATAGAVPRYGSTNGRRLTLRHAGFGALRCGYAYGGWICFGGWCTSAAKRAGIVIRVVVSGVVIVDIAHGFAYLTGIATSNFLDRLALFFQLAHVCIESGLEFALSAAKLRDCFSDRLAKLGQFLGTEQDKGDEENNHHLRNTHGTHAKTSAFMIARDASSR